MWGCCLSGLTFCILVLPCRSGVSVEVMFVDVMLMRVSLGVQTDNPWGDKLTVWYLVTVALVGVDSVASTRWRGHGICGCVLVMYGNRLCYSCE